MMLDRCTTCDSPFDVSPKPSPSSRVPTALPCGEQVFDAPLCHIISQMSYSLTDVIFRPCNLSCVCAKTYPNACYEVSGGASILSGMSMDDR